MTDVLIVGSGPTGLTLACRLALNGIEVRIVERRPGPHRESRGKTLDPGSLDVLEQLGVAARMTAVGNADLVFRKYFDGAHISDTPFTDALFIGQWQIEELLRERLAELGVQVEYGTRITEIRQDPDAVTARPEVGPAIGSRYLAGCDGGRSTTRKLLGIPFEGSTEEESLMVLGDVSAPGLSRDHWHQWFTSDGGAMLLCPIPGTDSFQLQASRERDARGEPIPPSLESFQRLFDRHAGMPGIELADPTWMSAWTVNVRMADRLREGRAFLAGDAGHVHPIAGGRGMNTGIQDAATLGRALTSALRTPPGPAREEILDRYEAERLPAAAELLADTTERLERVLAAVREPGRGTEAGLR
ncbi:FAD-dependent monooxygenase [Streptomyces sp. Isolate_45]|uniref:FAD-dependent monooxygenase n=1 Tax=Streptomyces sp. Isolate_45 TaxID=2950111 RepID=UPI002482053A|nr:FAD-dependent monooxygenase [Streptomyces sp. Isolate_45]MDA5285711.1 FAD-dependent monooxygenase [Streptomyces sp. Isolate_45]